MHYDVIGDIHGQADKLKALLLKLGYVQRNGFWNPPQGHCALFVGDLTDRGPQQLEAVDIVRRMVDAGVARCLLGNHEFNAIAYATRKPSAPHEFLREHSLKNARQHGEFLKQAGEDSALYRELVTWFRTLPPALDLGSIRAVHAWWNDDYVALAQRHLRGAPITDAFLEAACTEDTPEWVAMEGLTKGLEIELPHGCLYVDEDGHERARARARWWMAGPVSYGEYLMVPPAQKALLPQRQVPADLLPSSLRGSPVFIGHYWMSGAPRLLTSRLACVDYSAAKIGPLVCYRWQGEHELNEANFVSAGA